MCIDSMLLFGYEVQIDHVILAREDGARVEFATDHQAEGPTARLPRQT